MSRSGCRSRSSATHECGAVAGSKVGLSSWSKVHVVSQQAWDTHCGDVHATFRHAGVAEIAGALATGTFPGGLVVADLELFDGSGLEVLALVEAHRQRMPPPSPLTTVIVSRGPLRTSDWLHTYPHPWFCDRPSNLCAVVRTAHTQRARVDGGPRLLDYLVVASAGSRSLRLDLTDEEGPIGSIYVRTSRHWTAVDRQGTGLGALVRMVHHPSSVVRCGPLEAEVVFEPLREKLESVLGVMIFGEELDGSSRGVRMATLKGVAPPSETTGFEELWSSAVEQILHKNYAAAVGLLRRAQRLRPDEPRVAINLERLRALGFDGPGPRSTRGTERG